MTPGNLPGGQTWYFEPQIFWKEIFSGTHAHVVIEAASGYGRILHHKEASQSKLTVIETAVLITNAVNSLAAIPYDVIKRLCVTSCINR